MKQKIFFLKAVFVFALLIFSANSALASSTSGYAWSENTGWIDFSPVTVSDTALSGSAYGSNIGWVDMSTITNNQGALSGNAWGENVGWVDFSQVTINTGTGVFSGSAYSSNIGWISMNCSNTSSCGTTDYKVTTSWRPPVYHSSGGYMPPKASLSTGVLCNIGEKFSSVTGLACTSYTSLVSSVPPASQPTARSFQFLNNLRPSMKHDDVKELQKYLNAHNFVVSTIGPGSVGQETTLLGAKTKTAVIKFQKANNLTPDGSVGPITRGVLNNTK